MITKDFFVSLPSSCDWTYFASIFENDERETLIGIKEIDEKKAILFGFPEKPYEIKAE